MNVFGLHIRRSIPDRVSVVFIRYLVLTLFGPTSPLTQWVQRKTWGQPDSKLIISRYISL
jgi:hypothetical protein